MSCGAKNEHNDVCGETYTCAACNLGDKVGSLRARIAELERVMSLAGNAVMEGLAVHNEPCSDPECPSIFSMRRAIAEIKAVLGEK